MGERRIPSRPILFYGFDSVVIIFSPRVWRSIKKKVLRFWFSNFFWKFSWIVFLYHVLGSYIYKALPSSELPLKTSSPHLTLCQNAANIVKFQCIEIVSNFSILKFNVIKLKYIGIELYWLHSNIYVEFVHISENN